MKQAVPRRIVAAYDTETTNVTNDIGITSAFFNLYQVCEYLSEDIREATPERMDELTDTRMYRHIEEAWDDLISIADRADGYVPVVAVHNLSFDIYSLSDHLNRLYLSSDMDVTVLAKSPQKPVTITITRDEKPYLVFWDTLVFSGRGLATMGQECGYHKAVGAWDYDKVRTPDTPLTDDETYYAATDCVTLLCWLGYYFRREPLLDPSLVAYRLCTKTGAVRVKRQAMFSELKGKDLKYTAGKYWARFNSSQKLRDDDQLFTFHACTRGGFTFASREVAGLPIEAGDDEEIVAFDAKSQHPAHMVSHFVPVNFERRDYKILELDADTVKHTSVNWLLSHMDRPFPVAFDACFEFTNLRLKKGTVWERDGISPLAYARLKKSIEEEEIDVTDNTRRAAGYADFAEDGCDHSFGKVYKAPIIQLWLTELDYWIMCQVFDWDTCVAIEGYETAKFVRPTDFSVLSVMEFYRRKGILKNVRKRYASGDRSFEDVRDILPDYFVDTLEDGTADPLDLEAYYAAAKADLNSLYGIEITDEAKRAIRLGPDGLEYTGDYSAENMRKSTKACYQYGQRIVGWSRIAQTVMIQALGEHTLRVINGDTDSIKVWIKRDARPFIEAELAKYGAALDKARHSTTRRVREQYPQYYAELTDIGYYEEEATYKRFYSAYNKAYISGDEFHITLAGVPSLFKGKDGERGLEAWARDYIAQGHTWQETAGLILGYNVTIDADISGLNGRHHPGWATRWAAPVTDYNGVTSYVDEPIGIGLAPMPKTIGGYSNVENRINAGYATRHGYVNTGPCILTWDNGRATVIRFGE